MAFRDRKVSGEFEKRAPGQEYIKRTSETKLKLIIVLGYLPVKTSLTVRNNSASQTQMTSQKPPAKSRSPTDRLINKTKG